MRKPVHGVFERNDKASGGIKKGQSGNTEAAYAAQGFDLIL